MKFRSLRTRFACFTAALVILTLGIFATFSVALYYHEQIEAFSEDHTRVPSKRDRREAFEGALTLVSCYAILLPLATAASGITAWVLGRKFLRQLSDLTDAAGQIDIQTLELRLPHYGNSTEVTQLTAAFNDLLDRLETSVSQIQHFSADASHEFRMPLTLMKCEVEALLRTDVSSETAAACERLLLDLHRLNATCDSLLFLTQADAGAIQVSSQAVALDLLSDELLEDLSPLADDRGLVVTSELPPNMTILGDAQLLRRLLLNLLDNALKHNNRGGWIRITGGISAGTIVYGVENSGPSIPYEHRSRVFDRFYRVDHSRSRETGGAGLGLSLCREIVDLHGGNIAVDCPADNHTAFTISFPAKGANGSRKPQLV